MSILIKGMKMPKNCGECILDVWGACNTEPKNKLTHSCPLVELPDHGDLVDRDEFIGRLQSWALLIATGHGDNDEWVKCIGEVCDHLYDAPVIIPAERSEDPSHPFADSVMMG